MPRYHQLSMQGKPHANNSCVHSCIACDKIREMNLNLNLPPEIEAVLYERAKATGKSLEELALLTLQDAFSEEDAANTSELSFDSWLREFDTWVASHTSRNPRLDDSREGIYPDRW